MTMSLNLNLRRYIQSRDADGCVIWQATLHAHEVSAAQAAIVVCDMWDNHWSRGAALRVEAMAPRMNDVLSTARRRGVHIIHAPSDTLGFYTDSPARQRMTAIAPVEPPPPLAIAPEIARLPLPIDDSDHGSDTGETTTHRAWSRQHPALIIDEDRDVISDQGAEIYSYLQALQIAQVLIMGVHTNMCILNRSFGIKQMVKWGVPIALVRDLTDTMYNPASSPYVDHDAGTQLVIGYIERFWCPSIHSCDLVQENS